MIFISKAEHLLSFWNRGPEELGNGLLMLFLVFIQLNENQNFHQPKITT